MNPPATPDGNDEPATATPFADVRYSLPALLREVKLDRSSATFAMEKLDQATINLLFQQHRSRHEHHLDQQ
jgi:hypothetical protein